MIKFKFLKQKPQKIIFKTVPNRQGYATLVDPMQMQFILPFDCGSTVNSKQFEYMQAKADPSKLQFYWYN